MTAPSTTWSRRGPRSSSLSTTPHVAFIVSGPPAAFDRAEPVLRAIGSTIHVVGDAEQARVVKLAIKTSVGTVEALPGDWIIRTHTGALCPLKPDIFALTYDEVPGESPAEGVKES